MIFFISVIPELGEYVLPQFIIKMLFQPPQTFFKLRRSPRLNNAVHNTKQNICRK